MLLNPDLPPAAVGDIFRVGEGAIFALVIWFAKTFVSDVREFHKDADKRLQDLDERQAYVEGHLFGAPRRRRGDKGDT